jgi:molybdenum cofactor cytidylyltransferase
MRKISALLLAAGQSKRMGCNNKPLLRLGPKPAIRWSLDTLLAAGLEEVVVVLGPTGAPIAEEIADLPVILAWNTAPASDMAASVRIGLATASPEARALLVCPADYPLVTSTTIRRLLEEWERQPDKIIIPTYRGRKGHPVIFPRPIMAELHQLQTLRDVVRRDRQRLCLLAVDDEAVLLDMDTPEEYRLLQAIMVRG